jgi:hypothetical protein
MSNAPPRDRGRTFVSRDLPVFSTKTNNFFITDVDANKGIQCRFGIIFIYIIIHLYICFYC